MTVHNAHATQTVFPVLETSATQTYSRVLFGAGFQHWHFSVAGCLVTHASLLQLVDWHWFPALKMAHETRHEEIQKHTHTHTGTDTDSFKHYKA